MHSRQTELSAFFLTSVPLRSLGMYMSSVICTVRPKSTSTALSDIRTMLLAKENKENNNYVSWTSEFTVFQCSCIAMEVNILKWLCIDF